VLCAAALNPDLSPGDSENASERMVNETLVAKQAALVRLAA
jgi:hypothetical protein